MAKQATKEIPPLVKSDADLPELHEGIGTEIVEAKESLPAAYGDDAGLGALDNVGQDETKVPFFRILQSLSPEVQEQKIAGAKAGMILNTATQETFDGKKGLLFVPAVRQHNYAKFIIRDAGGGFEGLLDPNDPYVGDCKARADRQFKEGRRPFDSRFGKLPTEDATKELVSTFYLYGVLVSPETQIPQRGMIAFASAQTKGYQVIITRLMSMLMKAGDKYVPYPMWAHRWVMTTYLDKNKKGSFFNWQPGLLGESQQTALMQPGDMLYQMARALFVEHRAGMLKPAYEQQEAPEPGSDDGEM